MQHVGILEDDDDAIGKSDGKFAWGKKSWGAWKLKIISASKFDQMEERIDMGQPKSALKIREAIQVVDLKIHVGLQAFITSAVIIAPSQFFFVKL